MRPWWRKPQNDNLWQGVSGTNNPCPTGYRLPTDEEWEAELLSWSTKDAEGAFSSPLKLPIAGVRFFSDGSLYGVGTIVVYWSSTVTYTDTRILLIESMNGGTDFDNRANGLSVRCIKD